MKYNSIILAFFSLFITILFSCSSENTDEINNNDSVILKDTNQSITESEIINETDSVKEDKEKKEIVIYKYIVEVPS